MYVSLSGSHMLIIHEIFCQTDDMAGNEAIMEKSVSRKRVHPQQDVEQHLKLNTTREVSQSILSTDTKVSSYISEYVIVSSVSLMTTQVVMYCKDNDVCLECLLKC